VCNTNATECITVATFDPVTAEGWIAASANPSKRT
jgi:hypothetical protein